MIDENLPIFYYRPSKEKGNFDTAILLSERGTEARPAYTLRGLDPTSQGAKNKYAVALYDAYAPEILYGEVLLEPNWTQPSLSMEAVRANGGVAPPPLPLLPNEFTIHLYSPDQQVKVRHVPSSWNSTASWEFAMPQESFRRPSASALDRTESDPTARITTPMVNMRWKRMGKFSKDLMCYLTGKSQNPDGSKNKQKEPDIPLSFFHHFSELTVYEPNVMRLDIEDPKGFEVANLLAATTIRDVYFNAIREAFNISEAGMRAPVQTPPRRATNGPPAAAPVGPGLPLRQVQTQVAPNSHLADQTERPTLAGAEARKQWEIDAESAQLRYQVEEEERALRRQEYEDAQRAKRLAKEEEKADKQRRAAIEKETERLRREWEAERARIRKEDRSVPPRKEERGKRREGAHNSHRTHNHQPYLGTPTPDISTPAGVFGPEVARPKSSLGGGLNIFRSNDDKERRMLKKKSAIW